MKAILSIFRNGRRRRATSGATRKRPSRSFASTFAALEGRSLLSTVVGPVSSAVQPLSATTTALIETVSPLSIPVQVDGNQGPSHSSGSTSPASSATPPPSDPSSGSTSPAHSSGSTSLTYSSGSTSPASSSTSPGPRTGGSGPDDLEDADNLAQPGDHVALDVGRVVVAGQMTSEVALADFDSSEAIVKLGVGGQSVELGPAQGVDHPGSITLADLNGDHIPDLIVANTNGNNVLVFPGLGNGLFGPELNGGQGFAVGDDPVDVTVNYVGGDHDKAQLIVANAESNSVTILNGQTTAGTWSVTSVDTIATPILPVKTLVYDVNNDGNPDLLVCNTGSDDVTMYAGAGGGSFDPIPINTFKVGSDPEAMLVGPFDRDLRPDLVTVNAGSNDLTFIGDVFGPSPTTQTISSGGISPDAAFAIDPGHTGVMDLVVANGGDGRVAFFRGGNDGLQLAGVITQANIPTPTALAPASSGGDTLDFFAASAGDDSALLLQFDLGVASTYLPGNSGESSGLGQADAELFAQLMPFGESSLDLIAVLWAGSPDSEAVSSASNVHEPSTVTALYSPTEGQGDAEPDRLPEGSSAPSSPPIQPLDPSKVDDSKWANMISGVVEALDRPRGFVGAIAARDALDEEFDRPVDGLARLDLGRLGADRPFDADIEDVPGVLGGGTIRLFWPEGKSSEGAEPADSRPEPEPIPGLDGVEAPAAEGRFESVPLISSALLVSTRLIIKASPPRSPRSRGKSWLRRFVSPGHDRTPGDRPDPL
jgi:FG-GAP-like repeat